MRDTFSQPQFPGGSFVRQQSPFLSKRCDLDGRTICPAKTTTPGHPGCLAVPAWSEGISHLIQCNIPGVGTFPEDAVCHGGAGIYIQTGVYRSLLDKL